MDCFRLFGYNMVREENMKNHSSPEDQKVTLTYSTAEETVKLIWLRMTRIPAYTELGIVVPDENRELVVAVTNTS